MLVTGEPNCHIAHKHVIKLLTYTARQGFDTVSKAL